MFGLESSMGHNIVNYLFLQCAYEKYGGWISSTTKRWNYNLSRDLNDEVMVHLLFGLGNWNPDLESVMAFTLQKGGGNRNRNRNQNRGARHNLGMGNGRLILMGGWE